MKTPCTALTRPRIASGVPSASSASRITTLTMSAAPTIASAGSATHSDDERARRGPGGSRRAQHAEADRAGVKKFLVA